MEYGPYDSTLSRDQVRMLTAAGRFAPADDRSPDFRVTDALAGQPIQPVQEPDWDASRAMQEQQKRIFYARLERDGTLHRHARNAQERAAHEEWACYPDPLMRLFMPQFSMMASRGLESIPHTRNHVHLRIQEVAEALQRQARDDMAPHALSQIDLTKPDHRAALAAFLEPFYKRYDQHLHTREMEYIHRLDHVHELRYRWLLLHRFLVAHGFSAASVEEFIAQQEHLAPDDPGMWDSPLQVRVGEIEREASTLDPALRQFRENYEPPDRLILDRLNANEDGMRLAMAMGRHRRLGERASALASLGLPDEVMPLIWGDVYPRFDAAKIGYARRSMP
jgi:hypothetical protein